MLQHEVMVVDEWHNNQVKYFIVIVEHNEIPRDNPQVHSKKNKQYK